MINLFKVDPVPALKIEVAEKIYYFPSFYHQSPAFWSHGWEYGENHSKQSGLHVAIDIFLDNLQHRPMWKLRKSPTLKKMLRACLSFTWGLNCGFPAADVLRFTVWEIRGCPSVF